MPACILATAFAVGKASRASDESDDTSLDEVLSEDDVKAVDVLDVASESSYEMVDKRPYISSYHFLYF
jgi:hypothetical protein